MKLLKGLKLIFNKSKGFRICFERRERGFLTTDYLPAGNEPPIPSKRLAWQLALALCRATSPNKVVNIYLVHSTTAAPVEDYEKKTLRRYSPGDPLPSKKSGN